MLPKTKNEIIAFTKEKNCFQKKKIGKDKN